VTDASLTKVYLLGLESGARSSGLPIFIIIEAEISWSGRKSKPRYALFNPKPVVFEVSRMLK